MAVLGVWRGLTRLADRGYLRRWDAAARRAERDDLETLKTYRARARALRKRLDRVLHVADGRLALPIVGASAVRKPLHADWAYRPPLWRGPIFPAGHAAVESQTRLGEEATIFHDCGISEISFRQVRNTRETDLAPFGARFDVFAFDGSFLSLVVELPDAALVGLQKRHLISLSAMIETEKPLEVFARLNIRHGPNTEQIVREFPRSNGEITLDFDLAYSKLNERRIERMWLDLIFEGPELNQITLRDVTLARRPRAEI